MNIRQTRLPNGLLVITAALPGYASASVAAFVRAGNRDERDDECGMAHMNEHLSFKMTASRTALQISSEIESLGSHINAFTSQSMTAYYVNGLGKNVGAAVAIIGDVLTHSLYDDDEIDIERGVILQEIAQYEDDPQSVAFDALGLLAYPNQALGRPILGNPNFIKAAKSQDFKNFIERHYHTGNIVVVGSGAVEHESFVDMVAQAFIDLPVGQAIPRVSAQYGGGFALDTSKPFKQVSFAMVLPTVDQLNHLSPAHKLMANAFGGGMSSPLFQEIREKRGLVYSVSAGADHQDDHGLLSIQGGMTPENVEEFVNVSCDLLSGYSKTVSANDVERARNAYLVSLATIRENPFRLSHFIASQYFSSGEVQSPEDSVAKYELVTLAQVSEAAFDVLAGKPTISIVGPAPNLNYQEIIAFASNE